MFPPPPTASCHIRWGDPQASHQGCGLLFHGPQLHNHEALRFASMVYQLKITCRAEALCGVWGAEWAPGKVIGEERGLLEVARALLHLRGFSGGLGLWGSGGPRLAEAGGVKKILVRTSTELISLCMYRPRWMFLFSSLRKQGKQAKQVRLPSPLASTMAATPARKAAPGRRGHASPQPQEGGQI